MVPRGLVLVVLAMGLPGLAGGQEPGEPAAVIGRTCVTCHHADNRAIPRLPGDMDRQTLISRLKELRESGDAGDVTLMHRLVRGIDEDQIVPVAHYLTESS